MRKIIQIVSCNRVNSSSFLTALCDDGTLWEDSGLGVWMPKKGLPKEKDK